MSFLFVGEKPSRTAAERGWTWRDGQLAARTLFNALEHAGIAPEACGFVNLFGDDPEVSERPSIERLAVLKALGPTPVQIVALGAKVARRLDEHEVPHLKLVHPAARGAIRGRDRYITHVKEVLAS